MLKISRQALNKHIKSLIEENKISKLGSTKNAKYVIASKKNKTNTVFNLIINNLNTQHEDIILNTISTRLNLKTLFAKNAYDIIEYSFTEMLNNAIEHSKSKKCEIKIIISEYTFTFVVRDFGIGLFYSIATKFNLPNEILATQELLKGKITTVPQKHTGEGIFFTSNLADELSLKSHKINLIFNNNLKDIFVKKTKKFTFYFLRTILLK